MTERSPARFSGNEYICEWNRPSHAREATGQRLRASRGTIHARRAHDAFSVNCALFVQRTQEYEKFHSHCQRCGEGRGSQRTDKTPSRSSGALRPLRRHSIIVSIIIGRWPGPSAYGRGTGVVAFARGGHFQRLSPKKSHLDTLPEPLPFMRVSTSFTETRL